MDIEALRIEAIREPVLILLVLLVIGILEHLQHMLIPIDPSDVVRRAAVPPAGDAVLRIRRQAVLSHVPVDFTERQGMGEVVAEIIGPRELIAFCFEKVSERPVVEVAVFDLTGRKVLITVLLR